MRTIFYIIRLHISPTGCTPSSSSIARPLFCAALLLALTTNASIGAPFGMAWYQGDIETDAYGEGHERFLGRFNEETFIVAQGSVPAPTVHNNAFPDAAMNPVTNPVHTYHLGLWFDSPQDAANAGCPGDVTPFNGDHDAGIQVLNTSNFPDLAGPLIKVKP